MFRIIIASTTVLLTLSLLGCGTNFFGILVVSKDSNETMVLEEARNDLDDENYDAAIRRLNDLEENSNAKSLLLASSYIGQSGLDMWSIIKTSSPMIASHPAKVLIAFSIAYRIRCFRLMKVERVASRL